MVSDGVLLVQKLLKLFTFDAFCIAHENNKLAAILQGKPENAVLPCATNRQQILEGWMIWIIWWDNTNRYKDRNDQRQRKQIRPTS